MGYNKVIVNGVTKVDLTLDTVSPDTMLESTTAHNAAGDLVTGTIPVNPQLSVADGGAVIVPQGYYSGSELIGYLLPIPTAEDAKKVVRVNDSGTGYELVDPSELNGPVGVTETVTGNPAVLLNSFGGKKLQGLKVYGKSTQDGTPSPEKPAPIVVAGGDGSVTVTVSDGSSQSQSLTISPPNGLPGILVGSDGNYVDADGQERICDVADAENGKYIEYIHKINLYDNELNWSGPTETEINKNIVYQISNYVDDFPDASINKFELNCNILSYRNLNYDEALNGIPKIYAYGNVIAVQFPPNTAYSTLPAFKSMLQETQAVLYYQLKIPIETTFATEESIAYHGLTTYDGMTVVSTAEPVAGLEVKYLTELQSYTESVVDKKVSEAVTSAVILAQGGAV